MENPKQGYEHEAMNLLLLFHDCNMKLSSFGIGKYMYIVDSRFVKRYCKHKNNNFRAKTIRCYIVAKLIVVGVSVHTVNTCTSHTAPR